MGQRPLLLQQRLAAGDDPLHGRVPVRFHQLPVLADQGTGEAVLIAHPLPGGEQAFRPEPAVIDDVHRPATDPDHGPVLDRDVDPAAVAAQHARRLHPPVHVLLGQPLGQDLIHPHRPPLPTGERSPGPPHICYSIHHGRTSHQSAGILHRMTEAALDVPPLTPVTLTLLPLGRNPPEASPRNLPCLTPTEIPPPCPARHPRN